MTKNGEKVRQAAFIQKNEVQFARSTVWVGSAALPDNGTLPGKFATKPALSLASRSEQDWHDCSIHRSASKLNRR
jgi:hypothetical protein